MSIVTINLTFDNLNISVQIGDIVYYSTPPSSSYTLAGFHYCEKSSTKLLGRIVGVDSNIGETVSTITVEYDSNISTAPGTDAFVSFVKDKRINTSSLVGYYASINFVNNSTEKIELFAVGSDVSESSK